MPGNEGVSRQQKKPLDSYLSLDQDAAARIG
jgi:hypothetical protein